MRFRRSLALLDVCITFSFMIVGHTKFYPDGCGGLFERKHHQTAEFTAADVAQVASNSMKGLCARLVGGKKNGGDDETEVVAAEELYFDFAAALKPLLAADPKMKVSCHFDPRLPGRVFAQTLSVSRQGCYV